MKTFFGVLARPHRARLVLGALALTAALAAPLAAMILGYAQAAERASAYHARWELQSEFVTSVAGETTSFVVAFRNTGWAGWYASDPRGRANLGTNGPLDHTLYQAWKTSSWLSNNRLAAQSTAYVHPGQLGWFATSFKTPIGVDQGTYRFEVRPVIDGTTWLEDQGVYHQIYVPFSAKKELRANGVRIHGKADADHRSGGSIMLTPVNDSTHPVVVNIVTDSNGNYDYYIPYEGATAVGPTPAPSSAATPTPTPTASSSATATPTPTPTPTATPTPTPTPTPTGTATPTPSGSPAASPLPSGAPTGSTVPPGVTIVRDQVHVTVQFAGRVAQADTLVPVPDTLGPSARAEGVTQVNRPFNMAVTYGDSGSGVAEVQLWVRRPGETLYSQYSIQPISTANRRAGSVEFTYSPDQGSGTYSFFALAVDTEGNESAVPSVPDLDVLYDPSPPTATASSPAGTNASTFTVSATFSDTASGVASVSLYVKVPGSTSFSLVGAEPIDPVAVSGLASWTYTVPTSGSPAAPVQGAYEFYAVAIDAAGNVQGTPPAQDITIVDVTAPASAGASTQTTPTNTSSWTLTSAPTDNLDLQNVSLYVSIPGATSYALVQTVPAVGTSDSVTFSAYAPTAGDGSYRFHTRALDTAGNLEAAPTSADVTIVRDTSVPTATATSAVAQTAVAPWNVNVAYTDATSGAVSADLYVRKPGDSGYTVALTQTFAASTGGTRVFSYSPPSPAVDGTYFFFGRATDAAGNVSTLPTTAQTQTVFDATAPTSAATGGPSTPTNTTSWTFTSSPGDGVELASVSLYVRTPGGSYTLFDTKPASGTSAAVTFAAYTPAAGDGTYDFYTRATDAVGNVEAAPGAPDRSIVLDTTAAASSATGGPTSPTNSGSWTFTSTPTDAVGLASVELYVRVPAGSYVLFDTKPASGTSANITFAAYTPAAGDGTYDFYTRATDLAGNVEAAPGTPDRSIVYDTDLPSVGSVVLTNNNATLATGDTIVVTFDEAMATASIASTGSFTNGVITGVGSFATGGTNAGTFTLAWSAGNTVATITLTVTDGTTAPSGDFSIVTTANDVAGNDIGANATTPTGGF